MESTWTTGSQVVILNYSVMHLSIQSFKISTQIPTPPPSIWTLHPSREKIIYQCPTQMLDLMVSFFFSSSTFFIGHSQKNWNILFYSTELLFLPRAILETK